MAGHDPHREVRLTVHAKPNSRAESVTVVGQDDGAVIVEVRVRAKAVDGAANDAIVAALAAALGVRRREVTIVRGATSRVKHVRVAADAGVALLLADLPRRSAD